MLEMLLRAKQLLGEIFFEVLYANDSISSAEASNCHPVKQKWGYLLRNIDDCQRASRFFLHRSTIHLVYLSKCIETFRLGIEGDFEGRIFTDLINRHKYQSTYCEIVAAVGYINNGAKIKLNPNHVPGALSVHEFDVMLKGGSGTVPVEVKSVKGDPGSQKRYRAIKEHVRKAHDYQLPDGRAGIVHVFLRPSMAYDLFSSVEYSYEYIYKNLLKNMPKLGALVLDCVEETPQLLSGNFKRYLAPNPFCKFPLPETLILPLAHHVIESWQPVSAMASIAFSLSVPFNQGLPSKDSEVAWISSPHGDTQIRVFLRPSGSLRFDLITKNTGRSVLVLDSSQFSFYSYHEYRFEFSGRDSIEVYIDNNLVGEGFCEQVSRTKII